MGEPGDHLLAVQAVGAAHVGFPVRLGERLRLALAPLETQTPGNRDAVDEDGLVLVQSRGIAEALADRIEMRLAVDLVFAQAPGWAADEDGEVRHSCQVRGRMVSPGQPSMARSPASRSKNSGGRASSVQSSEVLPIPDFAEDAALDAAPFGRR